MNREINSIIENGFTNVKWYDTDPDYHYYDAKMKGIKVEVRTTKKTIEWRYLGTSLEDIEWFVLKQTEKDNGLDEIQVENWTTIKEKIAPVKILITVDQ